MRHVAAVLLVHGAGSGPWIWTSWLDALGDVEVEAVDLQAGLNVAEAAMSNYEAAAVSASELLPRPLAVVGWSMGGLVAMAAARRIEPAALVLLEPSPPAEVQGPDPSVVPTPGTFDPEQVYGAFPPGIRARPESALARAERERGISVPRDALPRGGALVVSSDEFPIERGTAVAEAYGANHRQFVGLRHWGLVLDSRVSGAVAEWLAGSSFG